MVWLKPHPIFGHPNAPFEVACPCVQTDRRRQHQTQNEAIQLHLLAFRSSDIYVYIYVYTCICTYVHISTSALYLPTLACHWANRRSVFIGFCFMHHPGPQFSQQFAAFDLTVVTSFELTMVLPQATKCSIKCEI